MMIGDTQARPQASPGAIAGGAELTEPPASAMAAGAAPRRADTSPARPRLGFAGTGWIGRHRLEAITQSDRAEIAAIFDPSADALASAAALAPAAVRAGRFEDLLEPGIDGVVIATPSALHASQAIAALEAGKAVFCQKPLARNAPETRRVIDAARAADRLLHVDLSYRFTDGMQRIRELVRGGGLGGVYAVEAVFHNAYGPDKAWFYDARLAGGGCLLDLGIHLVDLALWCLDFPEVEHVCGSVLNRAHAELLRPTQTAGRAADEATTLPVEDYAAAQLQLAGGISVQLACSWKAPAGCDAQIEMVFFGDGGGAAFRNVNGSFYDFVAEQLLPDRTRQLLAAPPDAWGGRAAIAWCRQLGLSPAFDPEIENLHTVAQTLDRIYGR
jgi:predicted dehydrogenase